MRKLSKVDNDISSLSLWVRRIFRTKYGKESFVLRLKHEERRKILDVGCGNNSPMRIKKLWEDCYYVGVDVGDYNNSAGSISYADEYHVFDPMGFADGIEALGRSFDAVISSHNLEHCNQPMETIDAMCKTLKDNGSLYMAFPNSASVDFPDRQGTLNFYDDPTHTYLPNMRDIKKRLKDNDMEVLYEIEGYRPILRRIIGWMLEPLSSRKHRILPGVTWAYWGFESIIWARKIQRGNSNNGGR